MLQNTAPERDGGVQDARVVDVLAAGARHGAAEDAPDERGADAGGDGADGDGDEQVAGRVQRERDAHHEPQRGDGLAGHEAGAERVPHVETAHEAAGFACEDQIFGHTSPWMTYVGGGHEPARRRPLPRAVPRYVIPPPPGPQPGEVAGCIRCGRSPCPNATGRIQGVKDRLAPGSRARALAPRARPLGLALLERALRPLDDEALGLGDGRVAPRLEQLDDLRRALAERAAHLGVEGRRTTRARAATPPATCAAAGRRGPERAPCPGSGGCRRASSARRA